MSETDLPAREAMEFDAVIVGAGPAGLSAAIRLKQINPELGVVVVEKGSEVGAHILSGAVIDPVGLDRLLPEWRNEDTPIKTAVAEDRFYLLGRRGALRFPNAFMPPLMNNHGNFIVSLGNVCRWLAGKAEALHDRPLALADQFVEVAGPEAARHAQPDLAQRAGHALLDGRDGHVFQRPLAARDGHPRVGLAHAPGQCAFRLAAAAVPPERPAAIGC